MSTINHLLGHAFVKKTGDRIDVFEGPHTLADFFSVIAEGSDVPRMLKDRFADVVSVKDFGAVGDGEIDDTEAFEAAAASGKTVLIPDGTYKITSYVGGGTFIRSKGALITRLVESIFEIAPTDSRLHALSFSGTFIKKLTPFNGQFTRAVQSCAYDKFDDVLYTTGNYGGIGTFVYAFRWSTGELLGTNYKANPFYGAFAHQGIGLYRPTEDVAPKFFSSGSRYPTVDTEDDEATLKLNLLNWDYNNPTTFSIERTWQLFPTSTYKYPNHPTVCVSEDGTKLCAHAIRAADNVPVIGVWNVHEILSASDGIDLTTIAEHIFDSPFNQLVGGIQGLACDSQNIYLLASSASISPHYVYVMSITTGLSVFIRRQSTEGLEWNTPKLQAIEGETLGFLPVNGQSHLVMGVSVASLDDADENFIVPHFYDLETAQSELTSPVNRIQNSSTDTSDDYQRLIRTGIYYCPAGKQTDLSGGAWILQVMSAQDVIGSNDGARQILYRGNTVNDVRTRLVMRNEGATSDWVKFVVTDENGNIEPFPLKSDGSNAFWLWKRSGGEDCGLKGIISTGTVNFHTVGAPRLWLEVLRDTDDSFAVALWNNEGQKTFYPTSNNVASLGLSSNLWTQVYAATGTINTSDSRYKSSVASASDTLLDAIGAVPIHTFQFTDAVEKKGPEAARFHVGVIAQEVASAFEAKGLDAARYGLFCHDEWQDEYETVEVVDQPEVLGEDDEVVTPAVVHTERRKVLDAGDRYGIRYEELLMLECARLRRELQRMKIALTDNGIKVGDAI